MRLAVAKSHELLNRRLKSSRTMHMSKQAIAKATYVAGAGLSFILSVYLWFTGSKEQGLYVGLWVPSILSFGTLMLGGRHE